MMYLDTPKWNENIFDWNNFEENTYSTSLILLNGRSDTEHVASLINRKTFSTIAAGAYSSQHSVVALTTPGASSWICNCRIEIVKEVYNNSFFFLSSFDHELLMDLVMKQY